MNDDLDDLPAFDPFTIDVPKLLVELGIDAEHSGDRWIAKCPNPEHDDHKASWDIKDDIGTSKHSTQFCFSCKWGGTATDLVAAVIGITASGARDWIRERCMGQQVIYSNATAIIKRADASFCFPEGVIQDPLEEWPAKIAAWVLGRGVTSEQVRRWRLGYAISGRLAGRIVVPAYDDRGALLNYTGRTYIDSPKRYLEPKRQEGPVDGAVFGEQFWPPPGRRELIVITEGALNALAVERVTKPGASFGSLFGSTVKLDHLNKVSTFRYGLVLTDPDWAGDRAAEKIIMALARHVKMGRVELPRGKDANDIEKEDPGVLRSALKEAWYRLVKS